MGNAAALEELFGIKDCEIVKTEELSKDDLLYKKIYLIYSGSVPNSCPKCGRKMYKHGVRHSTFSDTPMFGYPVELDLQFPRMRCSS